MARSWCSRRRAILFSSTCRVRVLCPLRQRSSWQHPDSRFSTTPLTQRSLVSGTKCSVRWFAMVCSNSCPTEPARAFSPIQRTRSNSHSTSNDSFDLYSHESELIEMNLFSSLFRKPKPSPSPIAKVLKGMELFSDWREMGGHILKMYEVARPLSNNLKGDYHIS